MNLQKISLILMIFLMIFLGVFSYVLYTSADKLTSNTIKYCADYIGENVICSCSVDGKPFVFSNNGASYFVLEGRVLDNNTSQKQHFFS